MSFTREDYYKDKKEREVKVLAEVLKPETMEKFFDYIRSELNLPNLKFTYNYREMRNGENFIEFQSDEIDNPLLSFAWKSLKISDLNSGIGSSESYWDKDYSKPAERVFYRFIFGFSYTERAGGHNASTIGYAFFNEKNEWSFRLERDK